MTQDLGFSKAYKMFSRDEAVRRTPYDDATGKPIKAPVGNVTVGIGRNLDAKPLSNQVIMMILREDVDDAIRDAKTVLGDPLWEKLSENRRLGFTNLAFNLGRVGLQGFKKMLNAALDENWPECAKELRKSLWARQVDPEQLPNQGRDDRVIKLIEEDLYDY